MRRPQVRFSRRGLIVLAAAGIVAPTLVLALLGFGLVDRLFHFQNEILQDYSRFSVEYAAGEIERQVMSQERDIVAYMQMVSYSEPFVPERELGRVELEYPIIEHAFLRGLDGAVLFGRHARTPADSCLAVTLAEDHARAERLICSVLDDAGTAHILLSGDIHFYVGTEDGEPYQLVAFPARDAQNEPRGIAGFFLNDVAMRQDVMARILDTTIHAAEGRFSQDFGRVLTFVVNDDAGREVYTHRHQGDEDPKQRQKRFLAQAPLDGIFPGWHVRITYTKPSGFAWSKRVLGVQAALLTLAALLAVLGTVFVVRFSLRQMELSRLKSHFVSNITHELKTPLAAIRLYTETLQQGRVRDRGDSDRFLGIIHKEAVRLTALINNILDFARIEDGQRRYSFAPGSVADVVHEVVDAYAFQMRNRGFEVQFAAAEGLPLLPIDRDAISQAVLNLIDNAVKYSPAEKHVEVSVVAEGPGVAVRVRDQGMGVPAAEQTKIFEAFYRVEKGLQHDVKGSGLGLAVVKHVAEAHGGWISLESELGAGSTFVLHLPGAGASTTGADAVPKDLATGAPWQRRSA